MSEDINFLLTDEFEEFSKKISAVHAERKSKKEEMKKIYDNFQTVLKELDAKAAAILKEWEDWKANLVKHTENDQ